VGVTGFVVTGVTGEIGAKGGGVGFEIGFGAAGATVGDTGATGATGFEEGFELGL